MSKSENILAFEAALKESKELQEKFEVSRKRIIDNKEAVSDLNSQLFLIIMQALVIGLLISVLLGLDEVKTLTRQIIKKKGA